MTIRNMPYTPGGRDNYDKIFRKEKEITYEESLKMASEEVDKWPEWKKIGLQTSPNPPKARTFGIEPPDWEEVTCTICGKKFVWMDTELYSEICPDCEKNEEMKLS